MRYASSTIVSILIHLSIAALLLAGGGEGDTKGGQKGHQEAIHVKIIEKHQEDFAKEEKPFVGSLVVEKKHTKKEKTEEIDCKDYYTGIGVETDAIVGSCRVTKVFAGYAAESNGVRVNDLIVTPPCEDIRGPENTRIDLVILRGTRSIHLRFKRGKVCESK